MFKDVGATITLASPLGGAAPLDPASEAPEAETDATRRFKGDGEATAALASTRRLSEVKAADYDAVFYPGGHGPQWDLTDDPVSIALIEETLALGKPLAVVCHAPCALLHAKRPDGEALIAGRRVTGFANTEEAAVGLTDVVPFLLEDALKGAGGIYSKGADAAVYVVLDGLLITGQNPASSGPAAETLLQHLSR